MVSAIKRAPSLHSEGAST